MATQCLVEAETSCVDGVCETDTNTSDLNVASSRHGRAKDVCQTPQFWPIRDVGCNKICPAFRYPFPTRCLRVDFFAALNNALLQRPPLGFVQPDDARRASAILEVQLDEARRTIGKLKQRVKELELEVQHHSGTMDLEIKQRTQAMQNEIARRARLIELDFAERISTLKTEVPARPCAVDDSVAACIGAANRDPSLLQKL